MTTLLSEGKLRLYGSDFADLNNIMLGSHTPQH